MLDLFSGLGGASSAARREGWDVVTVDIDPRLGPTICADIRTFSWRGARPDLVWASPPCEDFARESMPWSRTGEAPDLSLVAATCRLLADVQPKWWAIENVRGSVRHLRGWLGHPLRLGPIRLWGHLPFALYPRVAPWKERLSSRDARRALIPFEVSAAVVRAVEAASRPPVALV